MRLIPVLDGLADNRDARRAQQLAQLGKVVDIAERPDAEGTLARPADLLDGSVARWCVASVTAAFHCRPV